MNVYIIKKTGARENWNPDKIVEAINKSAVRANCTLTDVQCQKVVDFTWSLVSALGQEQVSSELVHSAVEGALKNVAPAVADCYINYHNWRKAQAADMEEAYMYKNSLDFRDGEKENANKDGAIVSTKRTLVMGAIYKKWYQNYFLTAAEVRDVIDGYIYIHDMDQRLDTMNCCLFDWQTVLESGFEMANVHYNEPKTIKTAFDVISDLVLSAASQQYGGFTLPEVDKGLAKYAQKSYEKYLEKNYERGMNEYEAERYAREDTLSDIAQGYQGWEMKWNTVASSRGDYPFITITFGLGTGEWEKEISKTILNVHKEGQGEPGKKKAVLFPKLVFLYDKEICQGVNRDVYEAGVECSIQTMYPDWLSMTGEGYISEMYKKYGKVISPMGCRAFLSPWYERGGMHPADENDVPVFVGRFNIGAVSLNLPMILAKSREDNRDFYSLLDEYLQEIREIHQRTYEFLGKKLAGTNPLTYCQGGFYNPDTNGPSYLSPSDTIAPLLKCATASFGITALNELQQLYNGKSIAEDGEFALNVMKYINTKVNEFKEEDGNLYAIYGTPAESLCLSGDTIVQCYDGNKAIKDVEEGDLVYSYNCEKKCIELKPVMWAGKTREMARVVKVKFDNGQEITCTPNHLFGVRTMVKKEKLRQHFSGEYISYVAAMDLKPGDRIKSNYFMYNESVPNRKMCSIYKNGRRQLVQDINAEFAYGEKPDGYVVHHIDGNKENNTFENLCYLSAKEHRLLHLNETIKDYQFTSKSVTGTNNPFYGKTHSNEAKEANRKAHIGKSVERFSLSGVHLEHFECANDVTKSGYTRDLVVKACGGERECSQGAHFYHNSIWYYSNDCDFMDENHRVESVECVNELIDVYDLTVQDNHNFFVGGDDGILVHNCYKQVEQFRKKYGVIENVSDREYVSNSFHCHVSENISPIQKQDLEARFWELCNGGKIQYVKYPSRDNKVAFYTLIERAMEMGFYEGVNLDLNYCDDCGYEATDIEDECPCCHSKNITKINRMNGYLAYSRVKGDTRLNRGKMAEIKDRLSM